MNGKSENSLSFTVHTSITGTVVLEPLLSCLKSLLGSNTRLILPEVIRSFQGLSHAYARCIPTTLALGLDVGESVDGSLLRLFCPKKVTLMVVLRIRPVTWRQYV